MSKNIGRKYLIIGSIILVFKFAIISFAATQNLKIVPNKGNFHPKLESRLSGLGKAYEKSVTAARALAQSRGIKINARDMVTVYLLSEPEMAVDEMALLSFGANITKRAGNLLQATVPIDNLKAIADNVEGISYIKLPDVLKPAVESEGVALTDATSFHVKGYTGSGVKVAVIDVGFAGLANAISHAELPNDVVTIDCTGASCVSADFSSDTEQHGTAVAEIIHDMAPGARLYLIKILNTLDLIDAKNYAVNQNIDIINHSLIVTNTNFYDGKCWAGNPVCTADAAYEKGILWVNAVGNEATRHYEATFTDSDDDGWHNVTSSSEAIEIYANAGDTIRIYLTWNAWPTTNQDYDLHLFDQNQNVVSSSESPQTGTQFPVEEIVYSVPAAGTYSIGIRQYSATSNHRLELYSEIHQLSPYVASSSLLTPADAASVLAVGAIDYLKWTAGPIRSYSSQGPTNDNRIKPDISGPDGVSNFIYGSFAGTSASCAHVSGAAALILSANSSYSASQLRSVLTSSAIDMGSSGLDNIYGYGRLNLEDYCPDDPNKIEAGICGCGTPDTDTDSDGTPDCIDNCDNDSNKTEPGMCGCEIPDTDTDGDGFLYCNDNCPNTANPSQNDIDGDGIGDACDDDTDNDGMPDDWEQQIIDTDPNDGIISINDVNPNDDFDNDKWSNLIEYQRGTDPTDPSSHPSAALPGIPLLLLLDE